MQTCLFIKGSESIIIILTKDNWCRTLIFPFFIGACEDGDEQDVDLLVIWDVHDAHVTSLWQYQTLGLNRYIIPRCLEGSPYPRHKALRAGNS